MPTVENLIDQLYSADRAVGKTGKSFDQLAALSSRNNLRTIEHLMRCHSPKATLEVGMAFGGSAVTFGAIHRIINPDAHDVHVAIDPFQSSVWDDVGRLKLDEAHLSNFVEIIEEMSSVALPSLLKAGRQFGLIYVDGSHLFEDVFIDAYYCMRLLKHDGYLLFDDSADPHVAKVLAFINSSVAGLKREPETTFRQTVARLLGKRQLTIYRRIGDIGRDWNSRFRQF